MYIYIYIYINIDGCAHSVSQKSVEHFFKAKADPPLEVLVCVCVCMTERASE